MTDSEHPIESIKLSSPTAVAHLQYDFQNLPASPLEGWTRFVCISDTHSHSFPVPSGDVLLHSGDLTKTGTLNEFQETMTWLYSLPHKIKIIIAGNHDLSLHTDWYNVNFHRRHSNKEDEKAIWDLLKGPKAVDAGIVYLEDMKYEFQTRQGGKVWSVFGSPWTPEFFHWAFNYDRGTEADELISKFPQTDILLTHGPPHKIFDYTISHEHTGCASLLARLPSLRPRLHLFGHIHEARGAHIHRWDEHSALPEIPDVEDSLRASTADTQEDDGSQRTVFVNAANRPAGKRSRRDGGERVGFGGVRFQPVIVDLRDARSVSTSEPAEWTPIFPPAYCIY